MALSNQQVQERLKAPKQKAQLTKAVRHEQWLRFHAEECLSSSDVSRYYDSVFLPWVKTLLPDDKYEFFKNMMSFPVYTTELCEAIQDELNKVFDSQNSSFTYEFTSDTAKADFEAYLTDMGLWSKWVNAAKASMLRTINSIVVIDMPKEAESTDPYFYFMPVHQVIDMDEVDGVIKAMIARQDDGNILLIDDLRYAVFSDKNGNLTLLMESFHELGYAPVCFFWSDRVRHEQAIVKSSPITPALNNLNYLLFGEISRRCLEAYAAYPIISTYESDCTFYEEIDGRQYPCMNGIVSSPKGERACPACAKKKLIGPGTVFTVRAPKDKNEPDNINSVVQTPAETKSLDYWVKRINELWDEIFYDCVGSGGDTMVQAVNQDQVRGNFESKQNILLKVKANLEISHSFAVSTIARLRYGTSFISCSINYGTKFYLQSSADVQAEYKDAKASGIPVYLLSMKRKQLDMANTKGNDVDAQRLTIMQNLEPWVDYTINEVGAMGLKDIDLQAYLLKADFSSRIQKFENEFGSIIEFGSKLDYSTKIQKIYDVLIGYGPQNIVFNKPKT